MTLELTTRKRKVSLLWRCLPLKGGRWLLWCWRLKWKTGWTLFIGRRLQFTYRGPGDPMLR